MIDLKEIFLDTDYKILLFVNKTVQNIFQGLIYQCLQLKRLQKNYNCGVE